MPLARDVGAVIGTGTAIATAQLGWTLTRYDAIQQLGLEWNFLTADELADIRVMQAHGDLPRVQELALTRLERKFGGSYERLRELAAPSRRTE